MNYEKEDGYYNVMLCNKKTKVNFTIHCVDEYDRVRTIKQVELYKCFGRDWYVLRGMALQILHDAEKGSAD